MLEVAQVEADLLIGECVSRRVSKSEEGFVEHIVGHLFHQPNPRLHFVEQAKGPLDVFLVQALKS